MKKKRWIEREVIAAVHDNDLVDFLNSIGLLKDIEAGKHRCNECDVKITLDNFGAVFPKNNNIYVLCDRPLCVSVIDPK
ncbi:MAG: hypothetical protein HQ551_06535 [Desulfobacteraceae bacterium]|nr:hypothetical protein [Desulfobacteraceae bacterium]